MTVGFPRAQPPWRTAGAVADASAVSSIVRLTAPRCRRTDGAYSSVTLFLCFRRRHGRLVLSSCAPPVWRGSGTRGFARVRERRGGVPADGAATPAAEADDFRRMADISGG
jgi:hypothetical protein